MIVVLGFLYELWLYWASTQVWLLDTWSGRASLLIGGVTIGFLSDSLLESNWSPLVVPLVLTSIAAIQGTTVAVYSGVAKLDHSAYPLALQPLVVMAKLLGLVLVIFLFQLIWDTLYVGAFAALGALLGVMRRSL